VLCNLHQHLSQNILWHGNPHEQPLLARTTHLTIPLNRAHRAARPTDESSDLQSTMSVKDVPEEENGTRENIQAHFL
jgi:hypothetical protein